MKRLNNKIAVISGATGPAGFPIAQFLLSEGSRVILIDSKEKELVQLSHSLEQEKGMIKYFPVNLTKPSSVESVAKELENTGKKVDIIINAAGLDIFKGKEDFSEEEWKAKVDIILRGSRNIVKYFSALMDSGSIVNFIPFPERTRGAGATLYSSLKEGIVSLTSVWARELAAEGIRVNAVVPGFFEPLETNLDIETLKSLKEKIPSGRFGDWNDLTNLLLFLSLPQSEYITGAIIPIDGGYNS